MRKLVLDRLNELRDRDAFSPSLMRWKNFNVKVGGHLIHISKVYFDDIPDFELLPLYERVIRTYYIQS